MSDMTEHPSGLGIMQLAAPKDGSFLVTHNKLTDQYTFDRFLGEGHIGVISLVIEDATGMSWADKSIEKKKLITRQDISDLKREIRILKHLTGHPNIVTLKEVLETPEAVHLILELCSGGELLQRIMAKSRYTERDAAAVMRMTLEVVGHCHAMGVVHRDIKPENILFAGTAEDAPLKLIDFEMSTWIKDGLDFVDSVGTPYYVAPEVLTGRYNKECDVWSCGVMLYVLLCGWPPFFGYNTNQILEKVLEGVVEFDGEIWDDVSEEAKDLIRRMLVQEPKDRATVQEVLAHPWMVENGVAKSEPLRVEVLERMRRYSCMNRFKKEVLRIMVHNLSSDDVAGMREMFRWMDRDRDGLITVADLVEGLERRGANVAEQELQTLMKSMDIDGNNALDINEFLAATVNVQLLMREERLLVAFQHFDKNGSGFITRQEVQQAIQSLPTHEGPDMELDKIMMEADTDRDGRIDYREFCAMVRARHGSLHSSGITSLRDALTKLRSRGSSTGPLTGTFPTGPNSQLTFPPPYTPPARASPPGGPAPSEPPPTPPEAAEERMRTSGATAAAAEQKADDEPLVVTEYEPSPPPTPPTPPTLAEPLMVTELESSMPDTAPAPPALDEPPAITEVESESSPPDSAPSPGPLAEAPTEGEPLAVAEMGPAPLSTAVDKSGPAAVEPQAPGIPEPAPAPSLPRPTDLEPQIPAAPPTPPATKEEAPARPAIKPVPSPHAHTAIPHPPAVPAASAIPTYPTALPPLRTHTSDRAMHTERAQHAQQADASGMPRTPDAGEAHAAPLGGEDEPAADSEPVLSATARVGRDGLLETPPQTGRRRGRRHRHPTRPWKLEYATSRSEPREPSRPRTPPTGAQRPGNVDGLARSSPTRSRAQGAQGDPFASPGRNFESFQRSSSIFVDLPRYMLPTKASQARLGESVSSAPPTHSASPHQSHPGVSGSSLPPINIRKNNWTASPRPGHSAAHQPQQHQAEVAANSSFPPIRVSYPGGLQSLSPRQSGQEGSGATFPPHYMLPTRGSASGVPNEDSARRQSPNRNISNNSSNSSSPRYMSPTKASEARLSTPPAKQKPARWQF